MAEETSLSKWLMLLCDGVVDAQERIDEVVRADYAALQGLPSGLPRALVRAVTPVVVDLRAVEVELAFELRHRGPEPRGRARTTFSQARFGTDVKQAVTLRVAIRGTPCTKVSYSDGEGEEDIRQEGG